MENNNTIEIVNNDTLIEIDDGSNIESLYNNFTLIDYASIPDIPKINSVKILGNLSSEDLGLASADKVEEKNNKVTFINENSTDEQYPSAKCVFNNLKTALDNKLNKQMITNCLTEIPQKIKLELNNGTLTLKAGSKVIVPNGFESDGVTPKFDEVEIESNINFTETYSGSALQRIIFYTNGTILRGSGTVVSGATAPALSGSNVWYDTANNIIKTSSSGSSWDILNCSFPISLITLSSGITSIDQIFNGIGYIGSTVWVDKGVKGLIPDGRNADGSLKNIEKIFDKVKTYTFASTITVDLYPAWAEDINRMDFMGFGSNAWTYDEHDNYMKYQGTAKPWLPLSYCTVTNGVISNFQPKTTFHALDYNDKSEISGWGMPSSRYVDLTLGASGATYTAPANGYVMVYIQFSSSLNSLHVRKETDSVGGFYLRSYGIGYIGNILPTRKGEQFKVEYNGTFGATIFRFIYAEGEV